MNKITHFSTLLWGQKKIVWNDIHPDVNIIVGINGKGKTTLLDSIYKEYEKSYHCVFLKSLDNIDKRDNRKKGNALTQELEYYIYDTKTGPSLMKQRTLAYDSADTSLSEVKEQEEEFLALLNKMFSQTDKKISLSSLDGPVIIGGKPYPLEVLSSGEKQLMLILLQVFLSKDKETLVLMDEPENSLHIRWQRELINVLVALNPHAQYFITTHSPSIFGDGWGDKITYMDNIFVTE